VYPLGGSCLGSLGADFVPLNIAVTLTNRVGCEIQILSSEITRIRVPHRSGTKKIELVSLNQSVRTLLTTKEPESLDGFTSVAGEAGQACVSVVIIKRSDGDAGRAAPTTTDRKDKAMLTRRRMKILRPLIMKSYY
jgi:hypothetical protein